MVLQRSHFAGVMCHFLGRQKTKWLPQGKAAPIVSHQQGFYSGRFPTTLRSSILSPFDDTSSFFQSITPACPGGAGSCLAVASSKLLGGRWQNGAPAVPLHLGRGRQGGKCLNLKFTTQVTGSLQLSGFNDVHCKSDSDSQDNLDNISFLLNLHYRLFTHYHSAQIKARQDSPEKDKAKIQFVWGFSGKVEKSGHQTRVDGPSQGMQEKWRILTRGWKRQILDNVEGFLSEMIFLLKSISNGNWSWERGWSWWKSSFCLPPMIGTSAQRITVFSLYKWGCAVSAKSNDISALDNFCLYIFVSIYHSR